MNDKVNDNAVAATEATLIKQLLRQSPCLCSMFSFVVDQWSLKTGMSMHSTYKHKNQSLTEHDAASNTCQKPHIHLSSALSWAVALRRNADTDAVSCTLGWVALAVSTTHGSVDERARAHTLAAWTRSTACLRWWWRDTAATDVVAAAARAPSLWVVSVNPQAS